MATHFEHPFAAPMVLLVPDVDSDGPAYWQHRWAGSRIDCAVVDMGHCHRPDRNDWITRIDRAVRRADAPVVLVGHGVGALAIAGWSMLYGQEAPSAVIGALLIGPTDPTEAIHAERLRSFAPLPPAILPFPSLVIASEDDPTITADRAFSMARQWGSGFARFGECGRFGLVDGLDDWPQGQQLLDAFIEMIEPDAARPDTTRIDMISGLAAQSRRPAGLFRR